MNTIYVLGKVELSEGLDRRIYLLIRKNQANNPTEIDSSYFDGLFCPTRGRGMPIDYLTDTSAPGQTGASGAHLYVGAIINRGDFLA
jgi:hypothetical protein